MMERSSVPVAAGCALALAAIMAPAIAVSAPPASPPTSLSVTIGGFPRTMPHCRADVYSLEFERGYREKNALVLRASGVPYRFDDGAYQESGRIKGLDIGIRHYRGASGAGLYAGVSLGYWNSDWSFMHRNFSGIPQGTGRSVSLRLNFEQGDRIVLGNSGVFLAPQLNLGRFYSAESCTYTGPASLAGMPCTQRSEVNGYWYVGLGAGVMF